MAPTDPQARRPAASTYLFLHVMKTGGSSLLHHLADQFGAAAVEPPQRPASDDPMPVAYSSLRRLRELDDRRRREVRVYAGHYPHLVVDLVRPTATFTILREPVDRAVSLLRQAQRIREPFVGRPLEEIYESAELGWSLVRDYQVKLFAMTSDDLDRHRDLCLRLFGPADEDPADRPHSIPLVIDGDRVDDAVAHLDEVTVFGFQERYGEVIDDLERRFGWHLPNEHRVRQAPSGEVPRGMRARLEADLAADVEFYRRATDLHARRRRQAGGG